MKTRRISWLWLLLAVLVSVAVGETRTYQEYLYDEAGHITGVRTDVSQSPPLVSNLNPAAARIGETAVITATGEGLRGVVVNPADNRVVVRRLDSSQTQVRFELQATNTAPSGDYVLTFTTGLGSTQASVVIQPRLPGLSVAPSPAAFAPGSGPTPLDIRLTSADIFDHSLNLTVSDADIATVNPGSITIPAGDTQPVAPVVLTPLVLGSTVLELTSGSLGSTSVPVFVTGQYTPPVGTNRFYASPLGVNLSPGLQPPTFVETGPFAATLSVLKQADTALPNRSITPLVSASLGILRGDSLIRSLNPASLLNGTGPNMLTVSGQGLAAVSAVAVAPPDGLTLGVPVPSADGTSLTLPVTVAEDAPTGLRQLVLQAGIATVPVASPRADRFYILDMLPRVESVSPLVVVRDSPSVAFTVRGRNLQATQAIDITPATGMVGVDPVINPDGTELIFNLSVPATEPLGARTLTVTTPAGTSDTTSSVANTFEVVNTPGVTFPDVVAPSVGVLREMDGSTAQPPRGQLRASILGVSLGGVVTGISPGNRRPGDTFTLTINGSGLASVDAVDFIPNTGISVSPPVVAADGNSLTVEVSISLDAPQTRRRVAVVDSGVILPPSVPAAILFTVTGFEPVIESVQPLLVEIGVPPVRLTIRGQFLDNAAGVVTLPPDDGVAISAPVVSADGRSLSVDIVASAGVTPGDRVVVVQTPAGVTSDIARVGNKITLTRSVVGRISDIVASQLGVVRQDATPPPPETRRLSAPLLGVERTPVIVPVARSQVVYADNLGVSRGAVAHGISPAAMAVGSSAVLTVDGFALDGVTTVRFVPADGVTTGAVSISPDGSRVSVPVTIAADAAATLREVVLDSAAGALAFTDVTQSRFRIAGPVPEILSIDPIQGSQGTTVSLLVRGLNLQDASRVTAIPADGITFAAIPVVNTAGTELQVQMDIATTATPVARVISVSTPVGATGSEATPANRFLVVPLQ
ncbi:hypothetical protein MNBD_GAMMA13-1737 [hydrothermal vent metagenome]|uniref:IPT/TIG domain-containing protein n=1 Tax=hydrothermal vent metagenome TaxID=652676 RepID=A0A3B0Z753_9ZZZZ